MRSLRQLPFFGREEQLRALSGLIEDHLRLVTLVGPAGIGKSRLAQEYAQSRGEPLRVDLSEVRGPGQLAGEMAAALRGSVSPARSDRAALDSIGIALAGGAATLVVLDNADAAVEALAEALPLWLDAAPQVDFVCTSRERLRIAHEESLVLGPLDTASAVALFRHRAPGVGNDAATEKHLVRIAERLEGNPLALSLAASRVGTLSPAELETRLSRPLDLLSSQERGGDARHESLRAAISVSWELLDQAARATLRECANLAPDFSIGAAEAVLSPGGGPVLDRLQGLCEKSLLRVETGASGSRFSMSDVVRDFVDRVAGAELDREALQRRHAAYLADAAQAHAAALDGSEGLAALEGIEADRAGIAMAARHFASVDLPLAVRLAIPLARALTIRGPASQVDDLLRPMIDSARAVGALEIAAELLCAQAAALRERREMGSARERAQEALVCAEEAAAGELVIEALVEAGNIHRQWGRLDEAEESYRRALDSLEDRGEERTSQAVRARYGAALVAHLRGKVGDLTHYDMIAMDCRAAGDARTEGRVAHSQAALFFDRGYVDDARRFLERSCDMAARTGGVRAEGLAWLSVGDLELDADRAEQAEAAWDRASQCFARVGFHLGEGFVCSSRARLAHERGELASARELAERALDIARSCGFRTLMALCHSLLAMLDIEVERVDRAASRMQSAVEDIEASGDGRYYATVLALAGWVAHLLGQPGDGAKLVDRARARLAQMDVSRASQREAVAALAALCEDADPDPEGRSGWEARLVLRLWGRAARSRAATPAGPTLRVAADARWFELAGTRVDLSRRGALRRVLAALVELRATEPGRCRSVYELLDDGWPAQKIHPEAGAQRVYWVIATLRKLGLGAHLQTLDDGYLLDPELSVEREKR